MEIKTALTRNITYIIDVRVDADFDRYCAKAKIVGKFRDFVQERLNRIGSYTATNSQTGDTYIARALPHMLRVQAI